MENSSNPFPSISSLAVSTMISLFSPLWNISPSPILMLLVLRQHRTIWQEAPAGICGSIQSLESEGILYVFLVFQTEEVGQKDGCGSQTQLRGVALYPNIVRLPRWQTVHFLFPISSISEITAPDNQAACLTVGLVLRIRPESTQVFPWSDCAQRRMVLIATQ